MTLSTVFVAIWKLSVEHKGGELLFDFRAHIPSNSTNHRQNWCSRKLSLGQAETTVLLESKGTLGRRNSGRRKQGQRPELTGRRPSPSEPPDQTAQPGGGHLLMGNRLNSQRPSYFLCCAVFTFYTVTSKAVQCPKAGTNSLSTTSERPSTL